MRDSLQDSGLAFCGDDEDSGGSCPPANSEERRSEDRDAFRVDALAKLSATLHKRQLLEPGQKVLVAVSGGQDSVSLIYLLSKLQSTWRWKLGIVHCDHQWAPSSRSQASHVAQIASFLGMDYYQAVATRNVAGESSARSWRYGILQRIASSHGYSAIVTAHTSSDRVETLLHNLFRGTGLHGLLSLTWKRWISYVPGLSSRSGFSKEGTVEFVEDASEGLKVASPSRFALVRPLLDTSRMELKQFCDLWKLPLWPDPSNFSLEIRRNRIRHQLLPFLRKNFQASIDRSLTRWAEILCGEDAFLESLSENIRKEAESRYSNGWGDGAKLDIRLLRSLPIALQRRVIKQFVEKFSDRSLGFDHVERLRLTCVVQDCRDGLHFSLPGRVALRCLGAEFFLRRKEKA